MGVQETHFPGSPLLQRILEQRVVAVLDKFLPAPSLINPIPMEEGGYQQVGALFCMKFFWLPVFDSLLGVGMGEMSFLHLYLS